MLPCCTVFSAVACCRLRSGWRVVALPSFVGILCCFSSAVRLPIRIGRASTIPSGPVLSDLRVDEDYCFGYGMAGRPWGVVRVAFAVGGVGELPWGRWLVVLDGSVSCYGGQRVLRLWVSFLLCWALCQGSGSQRCVWLSALQGSSDGAKRSEASA